MPFIPHTPEALLGRSDSKNPATTCKGITSSGRPCRRALASPRRSSGVLAVVSILGDDDEAAGAAAFFCWQHKDQAEKLAQHDGMLGRVDEEETRVMPLQERSSIDTLVQRLGVLDVGDESPSKGKSTAERRASKQAPVGRPERRIARPPTWGGVRGPLMSVPGDIMASATSKTPQKPARSKPQRPPRKSGGWASICCGNPDDDYVEVVRHRRRAEGQSGYRVSGPGSGGRRKPDTSSPGIPQNPAQANTLPARRPLPDKQARSLNMGSPSETTGLLSLIPKHLSPQTTSALLTELSKPISEHDEAGYIYIFWLTDEHGAPPPKKAASTLLSPNPEIPKGRRPSDVLLDYSWRALDDSVGNGKTRTSRERRTILLKIGRASNVQRRMNEWTRQCGYELSLVRWYPYVSSSPSSSPSPAHTPPASRRPSLQSPQSSSSPKPHRPPLKPSSSSGDQVRKVPHAHRVERLIHIELADKRVRKNCDACGKEHREWFEVEASRKGIREVDEVVRRWVTWGENCGNGLSKTPERPRGGGHGFYG